MYRLFALLLPLLAAGCNRPSDRRTAQTPPPLRLDVIEVGASELPQRMRFIGYLQSNFDAVIQPRVSGYLLTKQFESGKPVRKGAVLYTIDPSQLSTDMLSAEASLQSAEAQAIEARNNYERAVPLAAMNAISRAQLDQYTARHEAADAAVRSARQALRNARLNVGYTRILSPIDGIASGSNAHIGDFVGPGSQFTVLTTISNIDTLSVDLAIPMSDYLRYAGNRPTIYDNDDLLSDIRLTLADDVAYPYEGHYGYTRKDVSTATGTLVIVVKFPNPEQSLKPGQFARVEANVGPLRDEIVVPLRSVSQAQGVSSVWVVRPDDTLLFRRVETGGTVGDGWRIVSGLEAGERIVAAQSPKLREGMKIEPVTSAR